MRRNIEVKIPDGLKPGDKFTVSVALNKRINVEVPRGFRGGQKLQLNVELQKPEELAQIQKLLAEAGEGSGWVCLYALYIDSDVSREKGRKVSLECSCKKPTVVLMAEVLNRHGFKYVIEGNKRHPRDFLRPGRIRVHLKNADGTSTSTISPSINTRKKLLRLIGKSIPQLPGYDQYLKEKPPPIPGIDKDINTNHGSPALTSAEKKRLKRRDRKKKK